MLTALVLLTGVAVAQQQAISITKIILDGWEAQGDPQTWVGEKLYDAIDGWADYHLGFKFVDAQSRRLAKGDRKLELYVYRFETPWEAYGLYTVMRSRQDEILKIADEASFNAHGKSYLWRGAFVVEFTSFEGDPLTKAEFESIAQTAAAQLEGESNRPLLVSFLPAEKRIEESVLYFHYRQPLDRVLYLGTENVLLLGDDLKKPSTVEAAYAQYEGEEPYTIVLLHYEQADTARKALDQALKSMTASGATVTADGAWRNITDKRGKQTILWQKGEYLLLSAQTRKPAGLKALMQDVVKSVEAAAPGSAAACGPGLSAPGLFNLPYG